MAKRNENATVESSDTPTVDMVPTATVTFPDGSSASNEPEVTFETYCEKAIERGITKGRGDQSTAEFAVDIVEGASLGKISPAVADKKLGTPDQMKILWSKFLGGREGVQIHDRSDTANKTSQLRNFAKLGVLKDIDPIAVMDEIVAVYKSTYEKTPATERSKLENALEAYTKCARLQTGKDHKSTPLSVTEIETCAHKTDKGMPNLVKLWTKIDKAVTTLVNGKREDKIEDKSEEAARIALAIRTYTAKLVAEEKTQSSVNFVEEIDDEDQLDAFAAAIAAKREAIAASKMETFPSETLEAAE